MTKARADEIVRLSFYRNIDSLARVLSEDCNRAEIAYYVGRCIGMMQKDLENELAKEIKENEHESICS